MSIVIETKNLTRKYQTYRKPNGLMNSVRGFFNRQYEEKTALAPTNLSIEGGQIIGLVGANGAGKTTLLKLLSGLIYPTEGEASILGFDPWKRQPEFLRQISILLGQKNQLWWDIPAQDSFDLLASIYDLDEKTVQKRARELAELLQCESLLHVQLRRLSLGERMKMEIIGSLLHKPRVLFLDEPTIGLDIMAQSTIREFLASYVEKEKPTIILTSHYMDDISKLAHRLLLISQGQIVYDGTVSDFTNKAETTQKIILKFAEPLKASISLGSFGNLPEGADYFSSEIKVAEVANLISRLVGQVPVQDIRIEETDFEDVIHKFLAKDSRR